MVRGLERVGRPNRARNALEGQYVFENMGEWSLRKHVHYVTRLGRDEINLIIDGYLTEPPNLSVGIAFLVATKPHGEMPARKRLLAALTALLPEPSPDEPRGTAMTRTVLSGF